jgi:DNA transformation protein
MPDRLYDDPDELAAWAGEALAAAHRGAPRKGPPAGKARKAKAATVGLD